MKKRNFLLLLLANLAVSLQTARADNDSFNVQFIGTIVGVIVLNGARRILALKD